jgi:hypothetical protein
VLNGVRRKWGGVGGAMLLETRETKTLPKQLFAKISKSNKK